MPKGSELKLCFLISQSLLKEEPIKPQQMSQRVLSAAPSIYSATTYFFPGLWDCFLQLIQMESQYLFGIGLCPSYTTQFSVNWSTPITQNLQTGYSFGQSFQIKMENCLYVMAIYLHDNIV